MAQRATCQSAIVAPDRPHARFLVLACPGSDNEARAAAAACAALPALAAALAKSVRRGRRSPGLECAVGLGSGLWSRISGTGGTRPRELRPLETLSATRTAPATGGDVFLHIKSEGADLCLELARRFLARAGDALRVTEEVAGLRYLDSRDLTGFIDGTANPKPTQRAGVALIGREDAGFAGGSYALVQRYVHDLRGWTRLAVAEQEAIIGRRKRDSRELADAPPTAHIRRAELHEGGVELPIVRQSLPYGSAGGEQGLLFVAYSKDLSRLQRMLERLMGASSDGLADRLMDFTRPVTGAYFFVPSLRTLRALG